MEQRDETAITLHGLFAGYGRGTVLHGITARVPRSGVTAVVGPNGSGKSTLLSVAAGVVAPTGGSVRRSHARRPAVVVQRSAVSDALPITVEETVAMGRWAHRGPWRRLTKRDHRIVMECMAHLGVLDLAPRRLGELSGGQRQRALVAQGLAQESDLLLLDEPTTGLDAEARERISAVLDRPGPTAPRWSRRRTTSKRPCAPITACSSPKAASPRRAPPPRCSPPRRWLGSGGSRGSADTRVPSRIPRRDGARVSPLHLGPRGS